MENENITLNEASIFYKRIDKYTYLIGKDKDSYGQFLIEDAIAPLLFSSINEINRKKMTTDSLSPDRRFIFYFYLCTAIRRKTGSICCRVNVEIYSKRQLHSPAPAGARCFQEQRP